MDSYGTHFDTFLVGVAIGAAGHYFGAKFTDQRREQESRKAGAKKFRDLEARMPALFREMRSDLKSDETGVVREFFVLPSPGVQIAMSSKRRFRYDETAHVGLRECVDLLIQAGLVEDVTSNSAPMFRMSEAFASDLLVGA